MNRLRENFLRDDDSCPRQRGGFVLDTTVPVIILLAAFFLVMLQHAGHPFVSALASRALVTLVAALLLFGIVRELGVQWPDFGTSMPGYTLLWPA